MIWQLTPELLKSLYWNLVRVSIILKLRKMLIFWDKNCKCNSISQHQRTNQIQWGEDFIKDNKEETERDWESGPVTWCMEATTIAWWKWMDDKFNKQVCKLETEWWIIVVRSWLKQVSHELQNHSDKIRMRKQVVFLNQPCISVLSVLLWSSDSVLHLMFTWN